MTSSAELPGRLKTLIIDEFRRRERGEWVDHVTREEVDEAICNEHLPLFNTGIISRENLANLLEENYGAAHPATGPELVTGLSQLLAQCWDTMSPEQRARFGAGGLALMEQLKNSSV